MDSTVKNLLTLIKCALTDSVGILTDDINWDELYALASSHRITTLVYYGIKACKVMPPDSVLAKFEKSIYKSSPLQKGLLFCPNLQNALAVSTKKCYSKEAI